MTKKYTLRKRQNKILYAEFFLSSVFIALITVIQFNLHISISIIIAIAAFLGIIYLFFQFRLFRYIFSILFSSCWAAFAFWVGTQIDKASKTTSWVLTLVTFTITIWLHWDHFDFLRKTTVHEYERQ